MALADEASSSGSARRIGRYVLFDEIASGGMAVVHLGRLRGSVGFARTVAIKRLHSHFAKDPDFVSMFTDEARLAARIRHPNVAATLDVVTASGELFLIMEYIHGESLAKLIRTCGKQKKRVPVPVSVAIAIGTLLGLHAAHEATTESGEPLHVVHRDVSPQNIMVGVDGVARVLDFGVAKAVGRLQTTREGEVKGKTSYMSPEQLRGKPVDRRADVYAVAIVLWEALTGHRLFVADTASEVLVQVLSAEVEPPSRYASDVPPELDAIVMRALSRDPELRFATALDMAVALEQTILPPTPREVGAWVLETASDVLDARSERLKRIEQYATDSVERDAETMESIVSHIDVGPPAPLEAIGSQVSSISVSTPLASPSAERHRGRVAALAVATVAAIAAGFFGSLFMDPGPPTNVAAPPPQPPPAAAPAAAPTTPVDAPREQETPPPAVEAARPQPAVAATVAPPPRKPKPKVAPRPKTETKSRTRSCDPPYIIDADGIHIPKPECG